MSKIEKPVIVRIRKPKKKNEEKIHSFKEQIKNVIRKINNRKRRSIKTFGRFYRRTI
jgi:flagellar hook-basal body complex protein FliE